MKKLLFVLLLSILFIPVVFAKDTVEIIKVELDSKSEKAVINNEPTFKGLEINCDIGFVDLKDYVKYKVTIKNTYNEDFSIANKTTFDDRKNIKYEFSGEEVLKANDTIEVYVTITYENEIDDSLFVNGKYNENNKVVIQLLNGASQEFNPNTSTKGIMFVIFGASIIMFFVSVYLLTKKSRTAKIVATTLIICAISAPILAKALTDIEITVNVAVEIRKEYKVVYKYGYSEMIKATEVGADYNLEGCFPYYDEVFDEEHKYYECGKVGLYEDPKRYAPGEKVTAPNITTPAYDTSSGYVNGVWTDSCRWKSYPDDGGHYYLCENGLRLIENSINYWAYSKSRITENGFTYKDDDPVIMQFRWNDPTVNAGYMENYDVRIINKWNSEGFFTVYGFGEFTMPSHDVLFINSPPVV